MTEIINIKKDLQQYWNTQGFIYDFGYESEEECMFWRGLFREILGDNPLQILDAGTGTGFIAMNLAVLGHEVTGLDFSQDMMNQARKKMQKKSLQWKLLEGDAENPDFPDDSFDCVICRYLLWTLPDPDHAIAQWIRVVRPGGKIIVIDGKRKRTNESMKSSVNKFLWKISRRVCCGYTGIQGHDTELEKNLPYCEGIGAEEIIQYYKNNGLTGINSKNLDSLNPIVKRNLPWFLKWGYRSSGIIQIVWGEKSEDR